MTKKQFIDKWNVAYEDKEQQAEFAKLMKADLRSVIIYHNLKAKKCLTSSSSH